jgi:hypothetical protein
LVCVRRIRVAVAQDQLAVLEVRTQLGNVRRAIREEQECLGDWARVLRNASADRVTQPSSRWFAREMDGDAARAQLLRHKAAHRGLAGPVDAFERHEAREHPRGHRKRRT